MFHADPGFHVWWPRLKASAALTQLDRRSGFLRSPKVPPVAAAANFVRPEWPGLAV